MNNCFNTMIQKLLLASLIALFSFTAASAELDNACSSLGGINNPDEISIFVEESSAEHVREVLADPRVRAIEVEIGRLSVGASNTRFIEKDGHVWALTQLKTQFGVLHYLSANGETLGAELHLDPAASARNSLYRLPPEFAFAPEGSEIIIEGHIDSVTFIRTATEDERATLQEVLGVGLTVATASYHSDIDGFRVVAVNSDEGTEPSIYHVGAPGGVLSAQPVAVLSNEELFGGNCFFTCFACVSDAIARGWCYWTCIKAVTVVGAFACATCIVFSGIGIASCVLCYNCMT